MSDFLKLGMYTLYYMYWLPNMYNYFFEILYIHYVIFFSETLIFVFLFYKQGP